MLDCLKTALKFHTALSYIRETKMLFCPLFCMSVYCYWMTLPFNSDFL